MSERLPSNASPFSGIVAIIMIGVGTLAFIGIFALLAWSPDLANKNRAGTHPYSTSALGYSGLITLLEADGQVVNVSRLTSTLNYTDGLLVLTIPEYGFGRVDKDEVDINYVSEPALYVLPKWSGFADWNKPSWQKDTDLLDREKVKSIAAAFDTDLDIWRLRNPGRLSAPFGSFSPDFENEMQLIESDSLEAVIKHPGGTLLAKLPGREIYVLSDPDLLNTFGLSRRENARFALELFDWLTIYSDYLDSSNRTITFDATLHGFERSESLLRAIFDKPFLGASLIAMATMILITWAAFIRFGPPLPETRVLAFGKKALAESSAGLISMSRRESRMAEPYLQLSERQLARQLGLPPQTDAESLARTADRLAKRNALSGTWTEKRQSMAQPALGRNDLRDKALALWRWRQEMKDGH